MILDRKWIGVSVGLTVTLLAAPALTLAADSSRRSYSTYTPSAPTPAVRQHFNNAAPPSTTQKFNNASGASRTGRTGSGTTGSGTTASPSQASPKSSAEIQAQLKAFRDNARDIMNPRSRPSTVQGGGPGACTTALSRRCPT